MGLNRSLFGLIRDLLWWESQAANTEKKSIYWWNFKISLVLFLPKFNFRWHHHKMGEIIYHNSVYQYLHTRTQYGAGRKIQFSNRTMKIMFRFLWGNSIIFLLGRGDDLNVRLDEENLLRSTHGSVLPRKQSDSPQQSEIDKTSIRPQKPWKRNWQKIHRGSPRLSTTSLGIVYLALKESFVVVAKNTKPKWKCIEKEGEMLLLGHQTVFWNKETDSSARLPSILIKSTFPQPRHKNKLKIMSFDFMAFFFFVYSISFLFSAPWKSRNFAESTDSEKIQLGKLKSIKEDPSAKQWLNPDDIAFECDIKMTIMIAIYWVSRCCLNSIAAVRKIPNFQNSFQEFQ
jgi:hypothetical protein